MNILLGRLFWVVGFCVLLSQPSAAERDEGWLYRVQIPVESQSSGERRRAGSQALNTVLKRVTGLSVIEQTPDIRAASKRADRYYRQYAYSSRNTGGQSQTLLEVRFEPAEITKLVKQAELPVWTPNRPNIIAWVVVEKSPTDSVGRRVGEREILGVDDSDILQAAFRSMSSERGLPLIFPAMDLTDQMAVTTGIVWGQLSSELYKASRRYNIDAMLMGRIIETPFGYRAEWNFMRAGKSVLHAEEQGDYKALAEGAVDFVTRELVQRYAVVSAEGNVLRFLVKNVEQLSAYGGVLSYLGGLRFVDSVQVEELEQSQLLLAIQTDSSWAQFTDLLALDGLLVPQSRVVFGSPNFDQQNNVLFWQGTQAQR